MSNVAKVLLLIHEKNLVQKSSICDEKPKFKELLESFNRSISIKDLEKIKDIDIDTYRLLSVRSAVKYMVEEASKEWRQQKPLGVINVPCELCNNPISKEKYCIKNIKNNNELKVGSSCIDKFPEMDKRYMGINVKNYSKYSKTPEILERIIRINEICGQDIEIQKEWKAKYNEFNIIFPEEIEYEFKDILKRSKNIYYNYINGKTTEKDAIRFKNSTKEFNYLYENKCKKFHNENKDNRNICTKKIAETLKKNNLDRILKQIKKDGIIKIEFFKYIWDMEFVSKFKNEIESFFGNYRLTLKNIKKDSLSFLFKYKNFEPIELEIDIINFVKNYSEVFYTKLWISKNRVFENFKVYDNYKNVYEFVAVIENFLKGTGYSIWFTEDLYKKKVIELNRRLTDKFVMIDLDDIIVNYIPVLYLNEKEAKNYLLDRIRKIDKWSDKSDKEKYDIGRISSVWSTDES